MNKEIQNEFITEWNEKIKAGKEYREKYSTFSKWDTFRKMYRGNWPEKVKVPINKIFSYGRTMVPRVYFKAPRVSVTATHPMLVPHARVVEAIDNMLIREALLKGTIKRAVVDAFLCGYSPIKLGFDSEYGYAPDQSIDPDGSTVTQVAKKDGNKIEYHEGVKPGMPWALRCRPEDIILPWGCEDVNNLPWIAHYIVRPLKDVKQDSKYKNTDKLEGTRQPSLNPRRQAFRPSREKDKDVQYCELYEIRDYRKGEIIVICEDQVLLKEQDALQIEGLPYEFLIFNDDPEFIWGVPDAHILHPQQIELNQIAAQTMRHRAIALLKFLFKRDAIKPAALNNFFSGNVGPGIPVDDDNIAGTVVPIQPHIPPDLFSASNAVINAMRESIGFSSAEQMGNYTGTPRSASEVMTVAGDIDQRISERRDIVADVLVNIIRKWNQFIFSFWSEQRAIEVVGPEGALEWVTYTGGQLEGEYFLHIDPDSGMPLSNALKFQMGKDLLGTFNGDPMIDQIGLREITLGPYAQVDPRAPQLLNVPQGMDPARLAAARQPNPMGMGSGKGSGGGRSGATVQRPQEFDSFKKRFEEAK